MVILSMPIFCLKRILIAFGTIFVTQPVAANIMIYIYTSLFSLGFNVQFRPFNTPNLNRIDNMNELFILISSYFMMAFSGWIFTPIKEFDQTKCPDNPLLRYNVGQIYNYFIGVALSFNIIIIIFDMIKGLKLKYRKKRYQNRVKAILKK